MPDVTRSRGADGQVGRRRDVLAVLRESPSPMGVAEISRRLGVHPNTVRFHVDHLVGAGQVEQVDVPPAGRGRPRLVFRARRGMSPTGPRHFRLLAEILAAGLAGAPDALARVTDAARTWGGRVIDPLVPAPGARVDQAVDRLVGLLDDLGFAPERHPAGGGLRIGLRHCPFLEVVQTRGRLVCQVHLGLMQGATTALGAPVTVDRLEPFVEPDLCLAHLSPCTAAGGLDTHPSTPRHPEAHMDPLSLTTLADEQLAAAHATGSGRSSRTVHGGHGHALRQTLIALVAGSALAEHNSPGEATLQVLRGRVHLTTAGGVREATAGDHLVIPPERHGLTAVDDSAVLLTAVVALS